MEKIVNDVLWTGDLSARWGISPQAVRDLLRLWERDDSFVHPRVHRQSRRMYTKKSEVELWEEHRRRLGIPIPGERPRGPRPLKFTSVRPTS